jgi:hypothetical protein
MTYGEQRRGVYHEDSDNANLSFLSPNRKKYRISISYLSHSPKETPTNVRYFFWQN